MVRAGSTGRGAPCPRQWPADARWGVCQTGAVMELVIILIAIAVVVVAGLGTTFLVLPRRRRVSAPPRPPVAGPEARTTEAPPAEEERGPPVGTLPRAPEPTAGDPTLREPAPVP